MLRVHIGDLGPSAPLFQVDTLQPGQCGLTPCSSFLLSLITFPVIQRRRLFLRKPFGAAVWTQDVLQSHIVASSA